MERRGWVGRLLRPHLESLRRGTGRIGCLQGQVAGREVLEYAQFSHARFSFTVWKTAWVAPKLCTAFLAPSFEVHNEAGRSLQYEFAFGLHAFQGANDLNSL